MAIALRTSENEAMAAVYMPCADKPHAAPTLVSMHSPFAGHSDVSNDRYASTASKRAA